MLRASLIISTLFALAISVTGQGSVAAQSAQQIQLREAQERADRQRQVEQQRVAQALAEQQRDVQHRIERQQREQQRESAESLLRQNRARSLAEEQNEARDQAALLLRRRAQAEADRQRQIQQEQDLGQPPDTAGLRAPVAQPELPMKTERIPLLPLLAFIASCLLAALSLFMLGRFIHHRS